MDLQLFPSLSSWGRSHSMRALHGDCTTPAIDSSATSLVEWPWPPWPEPLLLKPSVVHLLRQQPLLPAWLFLKWIDMAMIKNYRRESSLLLEPLGSSSHPVSPLSFLASSQNYPLVGC